jgi:hypothetical protein
VTGDEIAEEQEGDVVTSQWWSDHPGFVAGSLFGSTAAGGVAGGLTATVLVGQHLVSPGNVLAGAALGFGSALAGLVTGVLALWRANARHQRRA